MAYDKSDLLYDDEPAVVGRDCCRKLGIPDALVLQTLNFCIRRIERQSRNERLHDMLFREYHHQGHWWLKGTYEQLVEVEFNFTNARTLRNIFERLEARQLVLSQAIDCNGGRKMGKRYRVNHTEAQRLADGNKPGKHATGRAEADRFGQGKADQNGQGTLTDLGRVDEGEADQNGQGTLTDLGRVSTYRESESVVLENRDNNNKAEARHEEPHKTEKDERMRVVVAALLAQNDVHEAEAWQLANAGLTEEQARQEIAALDGRRIDRNRGGMLFVACRNLLNGQGWKSATPHKPRRKLYVAPITVPGETAKQMEGAAPPMADLRAAWQGKEKGAKP